MTMRVRTSLMLIAAVAMMGLAGCDHYNCSTGGIFGGTSCTPSGSGLSTTTGTGNSGNAELALVYYMSNNQVGSVELSTANTMISTPNFVMPVLPTGYTSSGIVIAQQQFVYVPYGSSGELFAWSIDSSTGALNALANSPYAAPYVAGMVVSDYATTPIVANPAGTLLFFADATDSLIYVFQIDSTTGLLTAAPGSPFSTGGVQPWSLATDGAGKFLYVCEGNKYGEGVQMAVFTINGSTGALSSEYTMAFDMWQVQGTPNGQFMIGVDGLTGQNGNGGAADDNLYVFSINQASGVLTQAGKYATTNAPTSVAVHPNGNFVYDFNLVTSNFDGPLEGFALNAQGVLTALAPFSLSTPPDGGYFDQSGAYLFFHTASVVGVYDVDSSTGIPTEPGTPVGIGSGAVIYPWAVTDPKANP
ncbi:MAG: beta-propeller fold lactonase family protein [Candidatus Sulfotelmatobacter sp.]